MPRENSDPDADRRESIMESYSTAKDEEVFQYFEQLQELDHQAEQGHEELEASKRRAERKYNALQIKLRAGRNGAKRGLKEMLGELRTVRDDELSELCWHDDSEEEESMDDCSAEEEEEKAKEKSTTAPPRTQLL